MQNIRMNKRPLLLISGIIILTFGLSSNSFARRIKDNSAINELISQIRSHEANIHWDRLSKDTCRLLLEWVADKLGIPARDVRYGTFHANFDFLNGYNLEGLYEYYERIKVKGALDYETLPADIKQAVSREELSRLSVSQFIKKVLGLDGSYYQDMSEIIERLSHPGKNGFSWRMVKLEDFRNLLDMAYEELEFKGLLRERKHTCGLLAQTHFDFLSGKTLGGLYTYFVRMLDSACINLEDIPAEFRPYVTKEGDVNLSPSEFIYRIWNDKKVN